jgi:hypothetical protein
VSQWNLSVRLSGQGSDLSQTLRTAAGDARTLSRDIDDARREVVQLRQEASRGIDVRVNVDAGHLRSDVQQALSEAGAGQGLSVDLQLGNAMQLRRDVEDAVRWAAWGHRIEIPLVLGNRMGLRQDVTDAVRWASQNQTITVRVNADTSALTGLSQTLGGGGGGSNRGGLRNALMGLLLLAPAAIPLAAGLSTSLAPLAGNFAAAGAAGAAFGAALAGQVGPLSEAAEAEKKYRDAVTQHGASSTQATQAAEAYRKLLLAMPKDTQKAAVALSQLKENFSDWSDEMAGFTMTPVTKGIAVLDTLIPRLTPHVESASTQLNRLLDVAGGAVQTPGFDAMADKFADFTDRQLEEMTDKVMHFMRLLSEGQAPGSGPIQEFMAYARENGPEAREAISAISDALVTLIRAGSEAGPTMLTLVTAAARLVAALPPELVGIILQVAAALKLLQLTGAGMAALAAGIGRVNVQIAAMGATSAAAGGGVAGLRAAFLALGTAAKATVIVAALAAVVVVFTELTEIGKEAPPEVDKLTTSLGNLGRTGKVAGEAARAFGKDFSGLADSLRTLARPSNLDKVQQTLVGWTGFDSTPVKEAKEDLDAVDKALTNLVKGGKGEIAEEAFDRVAAAMRKQGLSAGELRDKLDDYKSALADQKFEQELAVASMGIFGQAAQETSAKLDAQKQSADGLRASIIALNDVNRSAYDAQIGFEQAVDDLTAAFKENGATLDLNTEAGRKNGTAMSSAAKAQDEMIAAGLAAGESLGSMTKKSSELRASMMRLAIDAFDGNKKKATEYVNTLLGTPSQIKTMIKLERQEAIDGLEAVQTAIRKTPGAKSIKVDTLNAAAIAALEAVGLKTRQLPDGRTEVYTANGQALGSIGSVDRALTNLDGKTANTYTNHHIRTYEYAIKSGQVSGRTSKQMGRSANGNIYGPARVARYANGGMRENHVAQIAQPTYRMWAEPETGGEAYIPFARSKRIRSRAIAEETVRRLGGDPASIDWFADGGMDFAYSSTGAGANKYTLSGLISASNDKKGNFSLSIFTSKLKASNNALAAWRKNLEIVAQRAGQDVADALAEMGDEGIALTKKMATGSTKYVKQMAKELENLSNAAKASLGEYTSQLKDAVKDQTTFQANLAKLAAQGYGDLATRLASQGDEDAEDLAAAAVKDKKKAASANSAAKAANNALSGDQIEQLVAIIAAVKTSKTGIHDVAAATGLGEDEIIDTATKATSQIKSALGGRATRFLADLGKANKGLAYENGGIRAGMYATRAGLIRFAEPSTGGEAYIPLGGNKRRTALPVLNDVAGRFGLGLTDANAGRVVVIREQGPLVKEQHWHIADSQRARDLIRQIDDQNSYQLRRLARGGVGAR